MASDIDGAKQFSSLGVSKRLVSALSINKEQPELCISLCTALYATIYVDKTRGNLKRAVDAGALSTLMDIATMGTVDKQVGSACQVISEVLLHPNDVVMSFAQKGFVPKIIDVWEKYKDNKFIVGHFATIMQALAQTPSTHRELMSNGVIQILKEILGRYSKNKYVVKPAYSALVLLGVVRQ